MSSYRCVVILSGIAAALSSTLCTAQESADAYPSKPVRIITSQAPGGTDVQARLYAAKLTERLGRQFVIDNRPGLHIAMPMVTKAPPDGYTLLLVVPGVALAPAIYKNPPGDPVKELAPISLMSRAPYLLVVNPTVPAKSVRELVALAKARPNSLNFGAGLAGSGTSFISMWFLSLANIKATYVPYKGVAQAVVDLVAGQIDAGFSTAVPLLPHLKTGRLRAVGISTAQRSSLFPDLVPIADQGVPGFDASTYHGWAAPGGTPTAIVNKLNAELVRIARLPDVVEHLKADNSEPVGSTPEEFRKLIAAEVPRWRKVVEMTGFKPE